VEPPWTLLGQGGRVAHGMDFWCRPPRTR
jgi:hypothetical protein